MNSRLLRKIFFGILVGGSSASAVLTNQTTAMFFEKGLSSQVHLQVEKSSNFYTPLTKEETDKRSRNLPPGTIELEPLGAYRYDFYLKTPQARHKIWPMEHYISPLANIPRQVTVFDAVLTNQTVYVLIRVDEVISIQPISVIDIEKPLLKEPKKVFRDFVTNGVCIHFGKFISTADGVANVELQDGSGNKQNVPMQR
jgi:hypothetical protein